MLVAAPPSAYASAPSIATEPIKIVLKGWPVVSRPIIVRANNEAIAEQYYIVTVGITIVIGAGYDDGRLDENCGWRTDAGRTANATRHEIQISVAQDRKCLGHC